MIKRVYIGVLISTLIIPWAMPAAALVVMPEANAVVLMDTLLGSGVTIHPETIKYRGAIAAVGIFSDDGSSGLDMEAGIMISSNPQESGNKNCRKLFSKTSRISLKARFNEMISAC
jgi:hypothetical protein